MFPLFNRKKITLSSEIELIKLSIKDNRYFAPIYERYYEQIFKFIYLRVDQLEEANDITSQVFLKTLLNLKSYKDRGLPFVSWIYRIALNEVNQYYRDKNKRRVININDIDVKNIATDIEGSYNYELQDKMIQALNELDELKVILLELRYFEKRSFKEIAFILDITESNAKIKVYEFGRALKPIYVYQLGD